MSLVVRLEPAVLRSEEELAALIGQAQGDGAVVSFVGLARPRSASGNEVETLMLDHHPIQTLQSLEQIAAAAMDRFDLGSVRVIHRCGAVPAGEPIIFAGATASHRRAAFDAVDYLMDRLKTDAIFWKQEQGPAGSAWIEATDSDHEARARWG